MNKDMMGIYRSSLEYSLPIGMSDIGISVYYNFYAIENVSSSGYRYVRILGPKTLKRAGSNFKRIRTRLHIAAVECESGWLYR